MRERWDGCSPTCGPRRSKIAEAYSSFGIALSAWAKKNGRAEALPFNLNDRQPDYIGTPVAKAAQPVFATDVAPPRGSLSTTFPWSMQKVLVPEEPGAVGVASIPKVPFGVAGAGAALGAT